MTTIARLSLAVPTTVKDRFATAFAKHLAPLLQKHGLIGVMMHNHRFPDGVFSRLY